MRRRDRRLRPAGPMRTVLLTLAVAVPVVGVTASLLTHELVDEQRASFEAGALDEARSVLVAVPDDIAGQGAEELSRALRRPDRLEVVLVDASGAVSRSSRTVTLADVPHGLRAAAGPPAAARSAVDGQPTLVVGGTTGSGTTRMYLFFSEQSLEQQRHRTTLWVSSGAAALVLAAAVGGWFRSTRRAQALSRHRQQERAHMAHLAHELRTPVGALVTAASLVDGRHLRQSPQQLRRPVEAMQVQTQRLRRIVEDLLELSRLEAGHVELDVEAVDLEQVVCEVVSSYGWDDVTIEATDAGLVEADRQSLARLALNLIGNARRHAHSRVRVAIEATSGGAVLTVSDDGPGLDPDLAAVLTHPSRPKTNQPGPRGHGLGLMITRAHADLLDAPIEVDTETGGTSIRVHLHAAEEPARTASST